jgi:hypothetical protein
LSSDDLPEDKTNKPRQLGFPVEIHPFRIPVRVKFVLAMAAVSVHSHRVEQSGDLQESGSLSAVN